MDSVKLLGAALVLGLATSSAHANLLTNGSFEQPGSGCRGAVTTLQGWGVAGGNIDQIDAICSQILPADGSYFVDLTGSGSGATISQSFATAIGTTYSVAFYFGGNSQWQYLGYPNDSAIKSMNALIGGNLAGTYIIDTTGLAYSDAGWTNQSFLFTATSALTTLSFASLNTSGVFGPLLDGVTVEQAKVPEPGTLALLTLGLAGLGLSRRRKA